MATDIETVYWSLVAIVLVLLPLLKLYKQLNSLRVRVGQESHYQTADDVVLVALVCYQLGLSAIWAFIESIGRERQISLEQMGLMLAVILPVSMLGSIFASLLDVRLGRANPVIMRQSQGYRVTHNR